MTGQYDTLYDTTITFSWVPPQGSGVETVVDSYFFSLTPTPLSHPSLVVVYEEAINVTLEYNRIYNAKLVAVNCAGGSSEIILRNVEFGKRCFYHRRGLTLGSQLKFCPLKL